MLNKKKIAATILSFGILVSGGTTAFASPIDTDQVGFDIVKTKAQDSPELLKIVEEAERVYYNHNLTNEEKQQAISKLAEQARKGPSKSSWWDTFLEWINPG